MANPHMGTSASGEAASRSHKASYTNASHDWASDKGAARTGDEGAVKKLYEFKPYPDLGADLKSIEFFIGPVKDELVKRKKVRFLDMGSGTGHYLVGVAKDYPNWECHGLELAHASAEISRELARIHKTPNAYVTEGSYLDDLPYPEKSFDVIAAFGTIHHCADPLAGMRACHRYLRDDGFLLLHLYGWRLDRQKFDMKEIINIFEPNLFDYEARFAIYRDLVEHRKKRLLHRLARVCLLDIYKAVFNGIRNTWRRAKKVSWSPGWTVEYKEISAPWADHFCHPCERAYEVPEVKALLDESGFEIVANLGQGQEYPRLIPKAWQERYSRLGIWEKMHLSELLAQEGGSFRLVLRKKKIEPRTDLH